MIRTPWLQCYVIRGTDERGNERVDVVQHPPPSATFWLGIDAEPAWPTFGGATVAAPVFLYEHKHISAGMRWVFDGNGGIRSEWFAE